jgi:hypothetical protein
VGTAHRASNSAIGLDVRSIWVRSVGGRWARPTLRFDYFILNDLVVEAMLLDDRHRVFGSERAVISTIAGNLFLNFGLNAIAQGFGQPGPVE